MEKADIVLIAQLLHTMNEVADKLDEAFKKKNFEGVRQAKKELMRLQGKVRETL
jgi:Zn-dependent M32 family carboxypeptidase